MVPLDYLVCTKIVNNAFDTTKKMVKTDVIKRHKPDFRKWGKYVYDVLDPKLRKPKKPHSMRRYAMWVGSVAGVGFISDLYSLDLRENYFPIEFSSEVSWPLNFRIDGLADSSYYGCIVLHDNPVWYGLRDELAAYNAIVKKYAKPRRTLCDSVKKIVKHYDTINEALAAWPALRFFLPESTRNCEYPFSGQPKPLPDGVDIAELTAMVTRAKLMEV